MPSPGASEAVRRLDKLYEFDREPVSRDRLLGAGHFAGSFAGEHVAATEFVIGALFVSWGATIQDIFLGLAIGNVLAVLTWTLVCAPIAVKTRLTLYWYLRRIGGPFLSLMYNIVNAVLFCILAGCMITVSASAVRIPFNIPPQTLPPNPALSDWLPAEPAFVAVVLVVGAVVVTLAILGFKRLAGFASVCSPWVFVMFIAGALVMLPRLAGEAGLEAITTWDDFWQMGKDVVWTGTLPADSDLTEPMGLWKVAAFAWICNLAMHAGLSDMALLRYARKRRYGLCSAFGMFLGHYLAWICAGMMGAGAALMLGTDLSKLDAGAVGYQTLGWAGAVAVIIAGWTTSNPTLYRAGLALQSITPNWSRAFVTLVAGVVTTVIACSPFVFTKLLDFVGIYGLLLVPAGAIVVTEHWIFPMIGWTRYWASYRKVSLNWPALLSWIVATVIALLLEKDVLLAIARYAGGDATADALGGAIGWIPTLHLFYCFIPVYALTAVLYIVLASMAGARESYPEEGSEAHAVDAAGADSSDETTSERAGEDETAAAAPPTGGATLVWSLVAVASLIACVAIPAFVWLGERGSWKENLDVAKTWLIVPSLVYFVSGTVAYVRLQRRREAARVAAASSS